MLTPADLRLISAADDVRPLVRAAASLRRVLTDLRQREVGLVGTGPPQPGSVLIGTTRDHPALARLDEAGLLTISAADSPPDAFEVAVVDGAVVVNGATPRAALYGAHEVEDLLVWHGGVPRDFHRSWQPWPRWRLLHPRARGGFHGYREDDFAFIARCGGNVAHLTHDWMAEKTLFSFVPCPEFPQAIEAKALQANRAALSRYLGWCAEFGLDAALWLCELPCQGGPWVPEPQRQAFLTRFPAECLADSGTYEGQVLCLAHPLVEQAYRGMVRRLLTDFPQLAMVLVFTLDSSGELCDPTRCPRHAGVSRLRQYHRLLALLATEGRRVRDDFTAHFVGWSWQFRGDPEFLAGQAALPDGCGLANLPDAEAWSFDRKLTDDLRRSREVTRAHSQRFLGYDILFWGDDLVFPQSAVFDFPCGLAAKLRRWQALGVDGFFDQWGTQAEQVQANALALRRLCFEPDSLPALRLDEAVAQIAAVRFGAAAAPHIVASWQAIEGAQQIQSDHAWYWHHLRPGWAGPTLSCPLTVDALQAVKLSGGEPAKPFGGTDLAPHRDDLARATELGPALTQAAELYAAALAHLATARAVIRPDQRAATEHWYRGADRLSPVALLDAQVVTVRHLERVQRRMGRFFRAYALVRRLPASGPGREAGLATLARLRAEDAVATE